MLTKNLVSGGQRHTQGFCKYLFPGLHFLATRTRTHARGFLQLAQKKGERGGHPIRFPFRFFHSPPRPLDGIPHGGVKTARAARLTPCPRLYHTSGNHAPKRRNRAKERSMPQQHTPNHARRRSTKKKRGNQRPTLFPNLVEKAAQKTTAANR